MKGMKKKKWDMPHLINLSLLKTNSGNTYAVSENTFFSVGPNPTSP